MDDEERVLEAVKDFAFEGRQRFHASYVAREAGTSIGVAQDALLALDKSGDVDVFLELRCPKCSRVVASYRLGEELPIGQVFEAPRCGDEAFEVTKADLFLAYSPTAGLVLRVNKEHRTPRKKKSLLQRLRRRIRSSRHRGSRSTRRHGAPRTS